MQAHSRNHVIVAGPGRRLSMLAFNIFRLLTLSIFTSVVYASSSWSEQ